ncbi:MAG TPA: response regulator [Candidatus Polarisedimenticolaceae bacterium]|nr:response regulator [Candidatus Polarisedimenticolaceae bacterium]
MKQILVVDDDASTRHLVQGLLKKAGHSVTACADGASALEQLAAARYDLVLLDVWMPELDGIAVLGRMRELPQTPPVIVMTTDDTPQTLLRAVREQAYQFINKPVDGAALLELVERVLAAPTAPARFKVISAREDWVELVAPCTREAAARIESFITKLDAALSEAVRDSVGHAFHELLLNAVEWGGRLDPHREVRIACVRTPRLLIYRIADPGPGFRFEDLTHSALSNPEEAPFAHTEVREQQGIRPGGFGLLMTKAAVDDLVYNEAQNEVLFVKYLDA